MRFRAIFPLLLAVVPLARATSVVPPSFPDLVAKAEAVYRGEVKAIEPRRVAGRDGQSIIKTFVTVAVERTLKGPEKAEVVLEFLGGTLGDEVLEVTGMPKFNLGQREYVFVQKNGVQFCPLVAVMHGRYRLLRDETAGREFVARDNGTPLTDVAEVELPMSDLPAPVRAAAVDRALTPAAFEAQIVSEVQRPTLRVRRN